MYKKIVVCLDGSDLAEQVIPFAAELAQRFSSELVLLRVVPDPVIVAPGIPGAPGAPVITSRMGRQVESEERQSDTYLRSVADRLLKTYGLRAESVTSLGVAGQTIVEYAAANEVDLIAIATHGRTGPGRVLFGSVADYVLRQSRLPVLLIRPITK
jgi:nucleotide-binding universal stress UspA family protein